MSDTPLVMGLDFGTDSVRVLVVEAASGEIVGKASSTYCRWAEGLYCRPSESFFRQHPLEYIESMEQATAAALAVAGAAAGRCLAAVCVDTTGSSPCPVDGQGRPLALSPAFAEDPTAMFNLWKDHTASREAAEFNALAESWQGEDYLRFQGLYSCEWFWAKILKNLRDNPTLREHAKNWIEECEWITAELAGSGADFARCATAAGHKALWHSAFGGLPAREFLVKFDPYMGDIYDRYRAPNTPDQAVATLSPKWREKWGAGAGVKVCGSLFDAHAGGGGCGVRPGTLVKVIGTSAVDLLVAKPGDIKSCDTKKLFGMAENSIIPGLIGIEAGQSAFGDAFRWFENLLTWAGGGESGQVLTRLNQACLDRPLPSAVAVDWFNGRRYPDDNDEARAALVNLDLGVDAPAAYQALVIGVTFGAKRMLEGFLNSGIRVDEVICAGGVARKSAFAMQTLADVLEREVAISEEDEACAKGAAMYAAVAAGIFSDIYAAQDVLGKGVTTRYRPRRELRPGYERLYALYRRAGDFMDGLTHENKL